MRLDMTDWVVVEAVEEAARDRTADNVKRVANRLGVPVKTLQRAMNRHGDIGNGSAIKAREAMIATRGVEDEPMASSEVTRLRLRLDDAEARIADLVWKYDRVLHRVSKLEGLMQAPEAKALVTMASPVSQTAMQIVAETFNVTVAELRSVNRNHRIAVARQAYCYMMRKHTLFSLMEIAATVSRDHTTVLYGVEKCEDSMRRDAGYKRMVEDACEEFLSAQEDMGTSRDGGIGIIVAGKPE